MEFSLYGIEGRNLLEGVSNFKYLGWTLDQVDDNWPAVRRNVKQAQRVWGRLRKILRR